jgi:GlpG protein
MRLIGAFDTEKEAYSFYSLLLKEGIQNIYEPFVEEKTGARQYRIWIYDEDDLETAIDWLKQYKEAPGDPKFQGLDPPLAATPPSPDYAEVSASEDLKWQSIPPVRVKARRFSVTLTHLIIILCGLLFLWDDFQEARILKDKGALVEQIAMTPLQQDLLFDYPSSYKYVEELIDTIPLTSYKEIKDLPPDAMVLLKRADEAPSWKGIYEFFAIAKAKGWQAAASVPMFEKIQKGEAWRLFTPCLLHANFLHILFNMIWVWILSKQIEERTHKWKMLLMILIIGIVSNVVQYLVSGPYFLGFSGVIVGMAGFIWMRQKKAPWEGYPLQKGTILFLLFFVLAMFAIELFTFSLQLFSVIQLTPNIANTAHIIGGLVGILLGRFSFFSRRVA